MAISETMQAVIIAIDNDVSTTTNKGWYIIWKGKVVKARGKAVWGSKRGARQAFHAEYGSTLSEAVLASENKPTYNLTFYTHPMTGVKKEVKYWLDIGVDERNAVIAELERLGLLEFKQGQ